MRYKPRGRGSRIHALRDQRRTALDEPVTPASSITQSPPRSLTPESLDDRASRRQPYLIAAIIATLLMVYGSLLPLEPVPLSFEQAVRDFQSVPYLKLGKDRLADVVANGLLLIPVAFLWLAAVDVGRRDRWTVVQLLPVVGALLAILIVLVEFTQQWFVPRTVSQNDMLAGALGSLAGAGLWLTLGRWGSDWVARLFDRADAGNFPRRLLQLYVLILVFYALLPYAPDFSFAGVQRKYEQGRLLLIPFAKSYDTIARMCWDRGIDVIKYLPVGVLFTGILDRTRPQRSVIIAALLSLALAAAVELGQLFMINRFVDSTDLLTAFLGGWIGAALASRWSQQGENLLPDDPVKRLSMAVTVTAIYAAIVAAVLTFPFAPVEHDAEFREHMSRFWDWPFKYYYYNAEWIALLKLNRNLMLFLPVGLVMRWGMGTTLPGLVVLFTTVCGLGYAIEAGQAAWAGQFADVTDVLMYLSGTALGWFIADRWSSRSTRERA